MSRRPKRSTDTSASAAQPAIAKATATVPRWRRPLILGLAAVVIVGWFAIPSTDTDTWWHLKTGQYILSHHALPKPDPFAYTTYLKPPASAAEALARDFNLTHEWLAQCVFYAVYAVGGFAGLILLRALLLAGFCGLVGLIAFRRSASFYRGVSAAVVCAGVAMFSTADRPFLFTYVLLALVMAMVEYGGGWWLLPPLFAIWANLHGGFFMGWVMLGCYCAESLYLRWRGKPRAGERRLWMVTAVSIAATGLNPNGFRFLQVLIEYRNSAMQSQLFEWQHTRFWELSWYSAVLWVGAAVLLWARKKVRPVDWLLFGLFAAASIDAARNVTLMALIGPVVIASYTGGKVASRMAAEWAAAALLLAALAGEIGLRHAFELHAETWLYPVGAADFLLAHHVQGRIFNTYEEGGYLLWRLWPEQRVFIDGRALNEGVYFDARRMAFNADATGGPSGEELLRKYGIDVIVMNGFEANSGEIYLLPASLADPAQKQWKLVYSDAQAMIFMRHPAAGMPVLNSLEALDSMGQECANVLTHTPWQPRCARSLGLLLARIGDTNGALRWLTEYRRFVPGDAEVNGVAARMTFSH